MISSDEKEQVGFGGICAGVDALIQSFKYAQDRNVFDSACNIIGAVYGEGPRERFAWIVKPEREPSSLDTRPYQVRGPAFRDLDYLVHYIQFGPFNG